MTSEIKFKVGDVIVAKSGGPKMTVESIDFGGIGALWFDKAQLRNGRFAPDTVEYAPEHD